MTATVQQIIDLYATGRPDRVHRQHQVPFAGQPGHYYFITGPRRPTSGDLAQITHQSQRAEAALFQIENCYCVYVGNPGDGPYAGTATFVIPHQGGPIEHFLWISHTHPLDAATSDTAMASGATGPDYQALREINQLGWQQTQSVVILCRGGRVEGERPFFAHPPGRPRAPSAPDAWFN